MKVKRQNVVSLYLSDEELGILKELAETDGRSKTQKARLLMLKGIETSQKENSSELTE